MREESRGGIMEGWCTVPLQDVENETLFLQNFAGCFVKR
jgi:hypothetical protein